jgi:exopolyphosphatase / guanosine-5'-triphosphate,3'-diphosphate pyrophosphatase
VYVAGRVRIAVVDLGTNSTRLLVAEVENGSVRELERDTVVTRLGEAVEATGRLADDAVERVFAALDRYRDAIAGAERTVGVATSAVRDAVNGDEFRAGLRKRFGIEARTIPGEEEARLTFLGATAGRATAGETLVIDIGGGSTEYVVGRPGARPDFHVSTRLGSVRHTERHLRRDPPAQEELAALARDAAAIIAAEVPEACRATVASGIAVAGTATSLAAIDQRLEPYDPERVHGYRVTLGACRRMLGELAALPVEERRAVPGLHPDRAPTIVAGAAILVESMRAFGLDRVEISERDILHGAALQAAGEAGCLPRGEAG